MSKSSIWRIPVAFVVIGLAILLFAHVQPARTATVTGVGDKTYRPARRMARGHSSAYYMATLEVAYTDSAGGKAAASVKFGSTNPHAIPKVGDEISICRGLAGMVTHPNRSLIGLGGGLAIVGGLFLFLFGLTALSLKRKR